MPPPIHPELQARPFDAEGDRNALAELLRERVDGYAKPGWPVHPTARRLSVMPRWRRTPEGALRIRVRSGGLPVFLAYLVPAIFLAIALALWISSWLFSADPDLAPAQRAAAGLRDAFWLIIVAGFAFLLVFFMRGIRSPQMSLTCEPSGRVRVEWKLLANERRSFAIGPGELSLLLMRADFTKSGPTVLGPSPRLGLFVVDGGLPVGVLALSSDPSRVLRAVDELPQAMREAPVFVAERAVEL